MKTIGQIMYAGGQLVPAGGEVDETAGVTYDVLRIMDGVPLFWEAHLNRVEGALAALGEPSRRQEMEDILPLLIRQNGEKALNNNVKILAGGSLGLAMGLVPSQYPPPDQYRDGVKVVSVALVRDNPELKVWNPGYKGMIEDTLSREGAYEALLVDGAGRITEGSRSNVFMADQERLYTPGSDVLPGITRLYVGQVIRALGLELVETDFTLDKLPSFNGLFLTGTSPMVLPIHQVDHIPFDPAHPLVRSVMQAFDDLVRRDLEQTARHWAIKGGE